jgi:uncharacterized protein (DUF58 family)
MDIPYRFRLQRFLRNVLHGEAPEAGPVTLVQRRVYILPTRHGLYFAGLLLVMLLGTINYNNSLGYGLVFLLAGLGIVAILHTYRNLLQLRVDVGHIAPVFCNNLVHVPVILDNPRHAARYALQLRFADAPPTTTDVPARHWTRTELRLPKQRRGRHRLPCITLHTIFPLGLFRAWAHVRLDSHYLVYPAAESRHTLPRAPAWHANLSGDRGHGSDDFAGLRNYHPGDSLRHVHWKAVARERGMYTKQFGGDRAEKLWLDWAALPRLDTEARLSRLSRWIVDAEAAQHRYGLRLPGTQIPLGQGPAQRHRCLEALALFQNGDKRGDA